MLTYNGAFEDVLRRLVQEKIDTIKEHMALGGGIADYTEYRCKVGEIAGLTSIFEMCDEVRTELDKR